MKKNNKNLGLYIQKNRILNKISIHEMASSLKISDKLYIEYENGDSSIYAEHLFFISKILKKDIKNFIEVYLN